MAAVTEREEIPAPLQRNLLALGLDAHSIATDFCRHFNHTLGCDIHSKYAFHLYQALAMSLRDRLMVMWKNTHYSYRENDCRRTYYLSMEFLMGRTLGNALLNLGLQQAVRDALKELDLDSRTWSNSSRTPASATAVSGVWRPVFSTAAPRCNCR